MDKEHTTRYKLINFIYKLFYPGLLGSMLYGLFTLDVNNPVSDVAGFIVAVLFCVDYIHLYSDIKIEKVENVTASMIVFDFIIAVFIGTAFHMTHISKDVGGTIITPSLILLCIVYALMWRYPLRNGAYIARYRTYVFWIFVVSVIMLVVNTFKVFDTWLMLIPYGIPVVFYVLYVFVLTPSLIKKTP